MMEFSVPPEQAGRSVEALLLRVLKVSKRRYRSLKWRDGGILRNGRAVKPGEIVRAGDVLRLDFTAAAPSRRLLPAQMPLAIVYEDEALLALDKPAGIPMHDGGKPSLAGALSAYLGGGAVHFVNRLDKGTSGLCVAAKNGYIHDRLRRALHTGAFYREYRGISEGAPEPPEGVIELPIGPAEGAFYRREVRADGRPCRTEYAVLSVHGDFAFLRLVPYTGRTHQLRVHLSALGHPLAGDALYGAKRSAERIARPALHSALLRLTHPVTGETLCLSAPLPEDMRRLLEEKM